MNRHDAKDCGPHSYGSECADRKKECVILGDLGALAVTITEMSAWNSTA
jgi:hypothetical protein